MLHDVVLVWPCCARARALGPLLARQGPGAHEHRQVALKMMEMLRAFGHPVQHKSQHHATMLQDVALKCCERLARPLGLCTFLNLEIKFDSKSSTSLTENGIY